jgi:hypothetical protein
MFQVHGTTVRLQVRLRSRGSDQPDRTELTGGARLGADTDLAADGTITVLGRPGG